MTVLPTGAVAPISRRAVAYVIDALIAGGLGVVLSIILSIAAALAGGLEGTLAVLAIGAPLVSLVLLGWFIVYTLMQSGAGSIGMRVQGVRLVRVESGAPLGFGRTLLRNIIFGLSATIVVGYFTPLFDSSGRFQGWHDKVAKSLVLDARGAVAARPSPAAQAQPAPPRPPVPASAVPPVPGLIAPPAAQAYTMPAAPQPYAAPAVPQPSAAPALPPQPFLPPSPTPVAAAPVAAPAPTPPATPAASAAPANTAPAISRQDDPLIAFVPGITQDAPPRITPAPVEPVAQEDAPEHTVLRADIPPAALQDADDIEETRISIPGHRLVFTWDDGTRISVSRRTLFGRNPGHEEGAVLVPVRDETLSLSKTHFEAAAEASGGWVTDRHSTNGTTIVRDGERIPCPPGEKVRIRLGDAIEIGDRIVTVGGYA